MGVQKILTIISLGALLLVACKDDEVPDVGPIVVGEGKDSTTLDDGPIDFSQFHDTYGDIASPDLVYQWAHYNVHDPSFLNDDKFVYAYSTDVAFGNAIRPGLQIRRSINLVEWEFVGWVFSGIPAKGANFIEENGGTPNNGIWAPYAMKVGNEYRVYYSLSSNLGRLSAIGLATADSPKGPFVERGLVVTSKADNSVQTNAIDPSVIVDKNGNYYMYYGSAWDGIYMLELDPETGLAAQSEDKGTRIAQRGFTGDKINGNIEGAEVVYNEAFDMYYLFISYDWLETKYNVRVGRSENANGPFFDYQGNNMNEAHDDVPMILAPYKFKGHSGWQGVAHPGVFQDDNGDFFIGHQGRPGVNPYYMVLHVRQIHWTEDGWPLVSCERYAAEEETSVSADELVGSWEQIVLNYNVVPGYAEEQVSPDFQVAEVITIDEAGTVNGDGSSTWTYEAPWLTIDWSNGFTDELYVERGRDWENEVSETILFTGLNNEGTAVWGKKTE